MQLHHFNFPFNRAVRITEGQLDEIIAHCRSRGYRHIGIYGMAEAGTRIATRLELETSLHIAGCFDQRHAALAATASPLRSILPPTAIAQTEPLDCLINTAPPAYLIDVADTIAGFTTRIPLLSLYDPFLLCLDEAPDYPYKLYWQLSKTRSVPQEVATLARAMRDKLQASIARWYDSKSPRAAQQVASYNAIIATEQRSIGLHLDSRLRQCMALDAKECVPALLELANEFPFFAMARDAAACLLVGEGNYASAAAAFRPALREYPHCHHTLIKSAELYLLAGDNQCAEQIAKNALSLAPGYCGCIDYGTLFTPDDRQIVLAKWRQRRILPPLEKRDNIRLRITSPVWGASYLDLFMRVTIPSLLASGNIPYAARHHDVCYTLYTRRCDFDRVAGYPTWQELANHIPVEILPIEDVVAAPGSDANKYSSMSLYHSDALRRSSEEGRFTFLTLGDFLFSDNFLKCGIDYVLQGYDTVFLHSTRFMYDEVMERIAADYTHGNSIEISPADLMMEGLPHLHQSQLNYLRRKDLPFVPNTYYATDGNANLIEHVFARTPLLLAPQQENTRCLIGLDVDLAYTATDGGLGRYALVYDTSEMAFLELTPRDVETITHTEGEPDYKAYSHWLHTNTDPVSRYFGTHSFLFRNPSAPAIFSDGQQQLAESINRLIV
jgi:hypothetical protein